jgi:hypothetical protein
VSTGAPGAGTGPATVADVPSATMTEARARRWGRAAPDAPIVLLGALAFVVLLFLARSMTFWQDEWGSITFAGGPLDFLRPVNEHWSTFPLLLYRATFGVVGLQSYLPYVVEVIVLHLVAVAAAYRLIRPRTGRPIAALACVPLLFLGSGSENLFWAFQTGFVGSVAFGLWALVLLERTGRVSLVVGSVLLLASLMSSGMGLFFLVTAAGRTLLDPAVRRRFVAVVPPAIAYVAWFVAVGSTRVSQPEREGGLAAVATFVARGVGHAVGSFSGLGLLPRGDLVAAGLFAAALLATGVAVWTRRPPPALAAGALVAVLAMYLTIGLVRAGLPSDFATRSRYVYVAAFLVVLAVADWAPLIRAWADARPATRTAVVVVTFAVLLVVTAANLVAFGPIRARFAAHAALTRAYIDLVTEHRDDGWVDPGSALPGMPPPPLLLATIDRFGSPVKDTLVPAVARRPGPAAREKALLRAVGRGFHIAPGTQDAEPVGLQLIGSSDAVTGWDDGCVVLREVGDRGSLTVAATTGSRIRVTADEASSTAQAALGLDRSPSRSIPLPLGAGRPVDVVVPDIGRPVVWQVRLDVPDASAPIRVCGVAGP